MNAGRIMLAVLFVVALFAALTAWTWETWPDVQVDYGREVYAAWRLAAGDVLHRDLAWFNGPLSVHVNALLLRSFGVSLRTLEFANLAWILVTALICQRMFTRWYGLFTGTLSASVFLAVFALSHGAGLAAYNFVCPYSHELTHGVMLALAGFALLARRDAERSRWSLAVAAVTFGCVLLTKAEVALGASVAFAAYLVFVRARLRRGELLLALFAFSIPTLSASVWFARELGWSAGLSAVLAPYRSAFDSSVRELPFYRFMSGLDQPLANGIAVLRALGLGLLFFLPLHAIERFAGGAIRRSEGKARGLAFVAATVLFALVPVEWVWALRSLPLFLLGWIGLALLDRKRKKSEPAQIAYAVFALMLLGKILFKTWALQYGFALAMPGALLAVSVLVNGVPDRLLRQGRSGVVFQAGALVAVLFFVGAHLERTASWLATKTVRVGEGGDAFWTDARGIDANRALALLEQEPSRSLLVLPEGALLNYLARRVNPTRFINFLPPEVLLFGEGAMVSDLALNPPGHVVLWHKDTSEYGVPLFGQDYGRVLFEEARHGRRSLLQVGDPPLVPGSQRGIEVLGPADGGER